MKEPRKMDFVFVCYMSLYYPVETVCSRFLMFSTGSEEYLTVGLLHGN